MASKSVGLLTIAFGANTKGFDKAMKKAQAKMKKFGAGLKKTGKTLSAGLTAPLLGFAAVSIKAFDTQAKAEASLLTALKGRQKAQKKLIEQAQALQKITLFGDEETIAAQTMLATMGLEEDAIMRLMPLIQDMAVAKRMQLVQAADLVAKSVGSSTNALSRYGITITGAVGSTERLDTAAEALTQQFQGQAEAAASVGAGALVQLKNQLGDISEEIGGMLMPSVIKIVEKIKGLAERFAALSNEQKENVLKWAGIAAAIGPVLLILGQLTIVISGLIPLLAKFSKFLVANPWAVAVLGALALASAMKKLRGEAVQYKDEMEAVNEVNRTATIESQSQVTEVQRLTNKITNQNTKLDEKKKALTKLALIDSEYFGKFDLKTLKVKELTQATDKYIDSIRREARMTAAKQKLIDLTTEQLDLEAKVKENEAKMFKGSKTTAGAYIQSFSEVFKAGGRALTSGNFGNIGTGGDMGHVFTGAKDVESLNNINKQIKNIVGLINKLEDETPEEIIAPKITGGGGAVIDDKAAKKAASEKAKVIQEQNDFEVDEYNNMLQTKADLEQKYYDSVLTNAEREENAVVDKYFKLIELAKKYGHDVTDLEKARAKEIEEIKDKEKTFNQEYWDNMGEQLQAGAENLNEYVANVKSAAKDAIGAAIAGGVAAAIRSSLETAAFTPWMIPIIAGLGAGLARSAFNSLIPSFAEGGLVSSPTLAMVGDSPHGPEMIMPINKLKAMMGGQNQNIVVTGRLSGTDIFLSNERTTNNRKRGV